MDELNLRFKVSIEVASSRESEFARVLLRKATMFKKEGMFDEAISTLRRAYREIEKTSTDFQTETFLRLPAYLQSAGRPEEAWSELQKLLASGYPNECQIDWVRELSRRTILDKMRLHLQRENNANDAIRYGALAYVAELRAELLKPEDIRDEKFVSERTSVAQIEKHLAPLFKRAKCFNRLPLAVQVVEEWLHGLPGVEDDEYESRMIEAVQN